MKAITLLGFFLTLIFGSSCNNDSGPSDKSTSSKCDTVYVRDTNIYLKIIPIEEFKNQFKQLNDKPILWEDFEEDSLGYSSLRKPGTSLENSTIRVRYDINQLASYLNFISKQYNEEGRLIDSVDVVFGKYPNADNHTTSGTEIVSGHRGKITVMFAGKGMNKKATPYMFPYNVGNPWP